MPDRETVSEELTLLRDFLMGEERKAFRENNDGAVSTLMHYRNVVIDSLALLKEQRKRIEALEDLRRIEQEGR